MSIPTLRTYTGKDISPLAVTIDDINIEDIAHGLALTCRFSGQCSVFFSVAQHSLMVSELVPPEDALWGLLHDASEAYLGDVPRPLKGYLDRYRNIETMFMATIADKYGLSWPIPESVHHVDQQVLSTELACLIARPDELCALDRALPDPIPDLLIKGDQDWRTVKYEFLARCSTLFEAKSRVDHQKTQYDKRDIVLRKPCP